MNTLFNLNCSPPYNFCPTSIYLDFFQDSSQKEDIRSGVCSHISCEMTSKSIYWARSDSNTEKVMENLQCSYFNEPMRKI